MPNKQQRPPQQQYRQPGIEAAMTPRPQAEDKTYRGSGKLKGKVAFISGGGSGIGRAVVILFAKEGADVAIGYLEEKQDAQETCREVESEGRPVFFCPAISAMRISIHRQSSIP